MRRRAWRGRVPLLLLGLASCVASPSARSGHIETVAESIPRETSPLPPRDKPAAEEAAIVVTIDGARWQDVFDEQSMPHLLDIARTRGAAIGAPERGEIRATGPNFVSLPGYTEILTGRAPSGCGDNDCTRVATPTIADEIAQRGKEATVFASWERLDRAASALGGVLVSAGQRGDLAERGDPWPGTGEFRPDRHTARAALAYLEHRRPSFLFLGLGEPDEYAHRGDRAGYAASLRAADATIADLFATLDRMGTRGARTTVIVTADHGRAHDFRNHGGGYPESARVWLVAAGPTIQARGFVPSTTPRRLADIAPTLRHVLDLPADTAPGAGSVLTELLAASPSPSFGPHDLTQLFSVGKSENKNRVAYALRLDERCAPLGDSPITPYWRMLEKGPSVTEPLLPREEGAYGILRQSVQGGVVRVVLRALPDREISIEPRLGGGQCVAAPWMRVAGVRAQLLDVFVQLRWPFGVEHLIVRGRTSSGRSVDETIEP